MKETEIKNLQTQYEKICNEIVALFCEKQGTYFEYWTADKVGEILACGDHFFNFSDVMHDMTTNQPKGQIFDWYNDNMENRKHFINYGSYCMGLRIEQLKESNKKKEKSIEKKITVKKAKKFAENNFDGLDDVIEDKDILHFYKGVIFIYAREFARKCVKKYSNKKKYLICYNGKNTK